MFTDLQRDWLNIAGLLLGLLGFAITIWQIRQAKSAAEAAQLAAREAKEVALRTRLYVDLETALAHVARIQEFQRAGDWKGALAFYPYIRGTLAALREHKSALNDELREALELGRERIGDAEYRLDQASQTGRTPKAGELNRHLSELADTLKRIQVRLEKQD